MYTFIFTSLGMIVGYLLSKKNIRKGKSLTSSQPDQKKQLNIPKFIGRKSLAIDFSNLFHFHSSGNKGDEEITKTSTSVKAVIPVATVKDVFANKIGIFYTEKSSSSESEQTKIKLNHRLVILPFNSNEVSILPPFTSFPKSFEKLLLCFDDEERNIHLDHEVEVNALSLGLGWWPVEVEKLVSKVSQHLS